MLPDFSKYPPYKAVKLAAQTLKAAGLPFGEEEAETLMMQASGQSAVEIRLVKTKLSCDCAQILSAWLARRISGEPVDNILGWREFYGRRFTISRDVLSPRGDSELLIALSLEALTNLEALTHKDVAHKNTTNMLDLGTGSGALLITLLSERPQAQGIGIDISPAALKIAQHNALTYGVNDRAQWLCGDWFTPLDENSSHQAAQNPHNIPARKFDLILSNPPYIETHALQNLDKEVLGYDPPLALDGGVEGLEAYHRILRAAPSWLNHHAYLILEIGYNQKNTVMALCRDYGFETIECHKDLNGHDRAIVAQLPL